MITGRDGDPPLFVCQPPASWTTVLPAEQNLQDTRVPIMEWSIEGKVRVTLHTFPAIPKRIPPQAQIARWRRQLAPLEKEQITQQSFAGFFGLVWEGENQKTKVLAWSMLLGNEHLYTLWDRPRMQQDWTLKAEGDPASVNSRRDEIFNLARSLEFVDEI